MPPSTSGRCAAPSGNEAEIRVARASLFAAQAIARDLIAAGREHEVAEIRDFISTIVPDPDANPLSAEGTSTRVAANEDDNRQA